MTLRTKTIWYGLPTDREGSLGDWDKVLIYDAGGGTYADETNDANNLTSADVAFEGDVNDAYYFGMSSVIFDHMRIVLSTAGAGGTLAWQYWNGSSWASLSITVIAGNANLTATPTELKWTPPTDWATTSVNSITAYWVRAVVTQAYTTKPVGTCIAVGIIKQYPSKTIYIPETTNRTFRSVMIIWQYRQNYTVPVSSLQHRLSISLGGGAYTYVLDLDDDIGNTGEHQANLLVANATSAFSSGFGTGSSQTLVVRTSVTWNCVNTPESGPARINETVFIGITYEYDDSATTRVKTVIIPIETYNAGGFATTLTEIGVNQVPNLDSFLPEASKTYRDIFFLICGTHGNNTTTDQQCGVALDSESEYDFGINENAQNSGTWQMYCWVRNDMATNSAHAFKGRAVTGAFYWPAIFLYVTYEYNHSNSSSIMNSLQIPIRHESVYSSGTSSADAVCHELKFFIEEPGPITLAQSAVMELIPAVGTSTHYIKIGSQNYQEYVGAGFGAACGQMTPMQRFDSGAKSGSGITLARGLNTLKVQSYQAAGVNVFSGISWLMYLNYISGKATNGDGAHNHTTWWLMYATSADTNTVFVSWAPNIPETSYYLTAIGFWFAINTDAGGSVIDLLYERAAGEGPGDGWEDIYFRDATAGGEISSITTTGNSSQYYKRYPADPAPLADIETSRRYRVCDYVTSWFGLCAVITYHAITVTVSGTVSGYTGDGSGIMVEVHRTDTDEKILTLTTSTGGSYSGVWYDNVINLYAHARQDSTHTGRSDDGTAS